MLVLDAEGLLFGPMRILAEPQGNDCHTCLRVARQHIKYFCTCTCTITSHLLCIMKLLFKKAFVKVACH